MRFSSFLDKKNKQARKELELVKDVLEEGEMGVEDHLESDPPYLFLKGEGTNLDFDGVRIYKVGSNLAYRIQKESKTEPYGAAYPLNIEEMFGDLITDMDEEKAAEEIKKAVIAEFKNFFKKSSEAQDRINSDGVDMHSKIVVSGGAGDLSNTM
jgi:hypothetical protein